MEWDCTHHVVLFSSDLMQGVSEGITQTARRGGRENRSVFVWNFPVNVTFKSTNPFGCESWEVLCTDCMDHTVLLACKSIVAVCFGQDFTVISISFVSSQCHVMCHLLLQWVPMVSSPSPS